MRHKVLCSILVASVGAVSIFSGRAVTAETPPDLAYGTQAFYAGNLTKATEIALRYLKLRPRSVEARILLARTQMVQGQVPAAYDELQKALKQAPGNIDVLYYLAQVSTIMAQGEYQRLFKTAPAFGRTHQLWGELHQAQGNSSKAMEEYQAAVTANPKLIEVWLNMGDLARAELRFEEAQASYSKALELDPQDYDALYGIGLCLQQQNNPDKAVEYLGRAVQRDPHEAAGRVALADALLKTSRTAEALKQLEVAVRLDPQLRQAYVLLGRTYQALGQTEQASASFKKAQELVESELEDRRAKVRKGIMAAH